jgi:hypothetical protein
VTRPLRFLAIALCCWLLPWLAHAQVQASLDRSTAQLGDTVTLNLRSQTAPLAAPDLSPLSADFEVLGKSSGSTTSFVNGQRTVEYSYGVALRPLHQGTLRIPPLTVGNETTQPLTLEVTAPSASSQAASGPVFVEATIDPSHAYVGQQLSLSVKLYYTANLANASLGDPRIDGVDVSRIGGDTDYQAERNGRIYNVIERRYVLVPQRAGELTIPPIPFQGDLLDPNDPDSFLGMGAPVSAQSRPLSVTINAAPADWGSAAWLPARKLSLMLDGLPDAASPLRVGQPFNLTLSMEATGLPFEALPSLSLPALDGATAYPDKPVTGNRADGPWVVGRRQQAFAIVPGKAGTLTVPAITVKWWNVLTDRAETATIPEHRFTVLSASGAPAPAVTPPATAGSSAPAAALPGAVAEDKRAGSRGLPALIAGQPRAVAGHGAARRRVVAPPADVRGRGDRHDGKHGGAFRPRCEAGLPAGGARGGRDGAGASTVGVGAGRAPRTASPRCGVGGAGFIRTACGHRCTAARTLRHLGARAGSSGARGGLCVGLRLAQRRLDAGGPGTAAAAVSVHAALSALSRIAAMAASRAHSVTSIDGHCASASRTLRTATAAAASGG